MAMLATHHQHVTCERAALFGLELIVFASFFVILVVILLGISILLLHGRDVVILLYGNFLVSDWLLGACGLLRYCGGINFDVRGFFVIANSYTSSFSLSGT
jgi:hypothetical protein